MFVGRCGYYDNGRLRTWLPYRRSKDSSALLHDVSKVPLLAEQEEKYFRTFYTGPRQYSPAQCILYTQTYLDLVEKYKNIDLVFDFHQK